MNSEAVVVFEKLLIFLSELCTIWNETILVCTTCE